MLIAFIEMFIAFFFVLYKAAKRGIYSGER